MNALKKALSSFSRLRWDDRLPEPEPFCARPRQMTGFVSTLTADQLLMAREYRGDDTHEDRATTR